MKNCLAILFLLLCCLFSKAQQRPHYSQYLQNMSVLNPAVTGLYQGFDFRLGMRSQWTGLEGAPKTGYFTFSTPFSFGGDMANYRGSDLGVVDPQERDEVFGYTSSMSHHAIGASFLMDKTEPLNRMTFNLTYAYHLMINDASNLSLGMGIGANRLSLDTKSLIFEEASDPIVGNSTIINQYTPDLNFGIYFYGANFYVGASMQQVIANKLALKTAIVTGKDVAHYFVTGGYKFWFPNEFWVNPSVMLKIVNPLPKAFDINLTFGYKDLLWLGTGYRKNDAFFTAAGFRVSQMIDIGYNYDFVQSKLRSASSGSHEITLRLLLNQ